MSRPSFCLFYKQIEGHHLERSLLALSGQFTSKGLVKSSSSLQSSLGRRMNTVSGFSCCQAAQQQLWKALAGLEASLGTANAL